MVINMFFSVFLRVHYIQYVIHSSFYRFETDETPTPVRLLRNCEEVGLFDDLKHNPFEETFRQAIYSKDKQSFAQRPLGLLVNNDDDTLHTPNILPRIIPNTGKIHNSTAHDIASVVDCKIDHSTIIDCSSTNDKQREPTLKKVPRIILNHYPTKETKLFRKICPKPHVIPAPTYIVDPIKEHIKDSLYKLRATNHGDTNSKSIDSTADHLVQIGSSNQPTKAVVKSSNKYVSKQMATKVPLGKVASTKSADVVERNREAAKRYRNKQKIQHEELFRRNAELEAENNRLKQELELMKKTHANCMVTVLQNERATKS